MENFPLPMGAGFWTPLQLIENGDVVQRFVSTKLATYPNTFQELENDDWPYAGSAVKNAFDIRERETGKYSGVYAPVSPHAGFRLLNLHFQSPQFGYDMSVMVPIVMRALSWRLEERDNARGIMAFGGSEYSREQNKHVRKRLLWSALTCYQRGVIFYMLVFAPAVASESLGLEGFTQDSMVLTGSGIPKDQVLEAIRICNAFNPDLKHQNMALRYSLWAACGGFADLFDVFNGAEPDKRHFRRDVGDWDVPHAVLQLYQAATANGWRAPIQYASLGSVYDATEDKLKNAFVLSSNVCYYSLTVEQALCVLTV
jgi:hypothetical protein